MDNVETSKAQQTLLEISKIIETEYAGDANALLAEGFVLLGVSNCIFEDSENRFVYTLGFPKPITQLSEATKSNF